MQFAKRLLLARKKLGESQVNFAKGLGIKQGSYSDLERGKVSTISESTLILLEINFGINREWLLNGTGEMILSSDGKNAGREYDEIEKLKREIKEKDKEIENLKNALLKIKSFTNGV